MKLLVLGATGGVGQEIVRQATERGHAVTALVRSPEALRKSGEPVEIRLGNLLDSPELKTAAEGHDAVLSAFGPRVPVAKTDHELLERFARALVPAMREAKVRRLILVSTAFLFRDSILPPAYLFGRLLFPTVVRDAQRMEDILRESDLDWTIVRPPRLTDGARTQKYRVRENHLPTFGFRVSRADVADVMLKETEKNAHMRTIVGVCL